MRTTSLLLILLYTIFSGDNPDVGQVITFGGINFERLAEEKEVGIEVVPLVAEKPIIPLVAPKPEVEPVAQWEPSVPNAVPPLKAEKPVYDYNRTVELIDQYIKDGGTEAYVKDMSRVHHIQWHDAKDGFINFPKSVVQRLDVKRQQYLHGYLHAMEDGDVENIQCTPEQLERVLDQVPVEDKENSGGFDFKNNRIVFFTAKWCGPCQQFKKTGVLDRMKKEGWEIGPGENNAIQIVDVDENKNRYGLSGVMMPTWYIIRDGKLDPSSGISPHTFVKNGKLQGNKLKDWIIKKGNIFEW